MIKDGEIWINKQDDIVEVRYEPRQSMPEYMFKCYIPGTDTFLFSCTETGIYNTRFTSDSDLDRQLTSDKNPEYFL